MLKILSLAGGVAGAVALSQYPEFSQQYLQRLAGQVDALTTVVVDFDQSALASGLGREEALQQMTGTAFLNDRQLDMRQTFARHARLSEDLAVMREATSLERLALPHRLADGETFAATWTDFAPAVPTSLAGGVAAGAGFVGGWLFAGAILSALAAPFRAMWRRRQARMARAAEAGVRRDPPVLRPPRPVLVLNNPNAAPTVMGEMR